MTVTPCTDIGQTSHQLRIIGPPPNFDRFDIVGCPAPYTLTPGSTVRGTARYRVNSKKVGVDIPGETITNIRAEPRNIAVPISIHDENEAALETAVNRLGGLLSTAEGPCRLLWTRTDGTQREITARYMSGAETLRITDLDNHRHAEAQLLFRAHYPYWRPLGGTISDFGGGLNNAGGGGISHLTFDNPGDVRTWPELIVRGPCENIELASLTTGQLIRIVEVLTTGQEIRIDTDPRIRGVYLDDVWKPSVLDPSQADMWPLLPGVNNIVFRATSPGDAGTWVARWPHLYESP